MVAGFVFLNVRIDKDTIEMMLPDVRAKEVMDWFKSEASARVSTRDGWQVDPIVKTIIQARVEMESWRTTREYREKAEEADKVYVQLLNSIPQK